MGTTTRAGLWAAGVAAGLAIPAAAHAFCGFYVASAEEELVNNATVVVMMREGTTTVLSMQNDYQGPTEDFAMVVPVPVVLQEENVKTLERDVFERVNRLAAPRLVEYWEQDPCNQGTIGLGNLGTIGRGGGGGTGSGYGRGPGGYVRVEAEFAVGEYDIVILSSNDSAALDTWLRQNDYRIPEGAEDVLRPYVEQGMKFFVAKVDADRATFEDGRAVLSPLRFHYDDESFRLPVRLGLLNSPGKQDLVVHVLARNQRYEVANYGNVTIPTNIEVADEVRQRFGAFYAALLEKTLDQNPGAVVTEYSWQATGCDPCPGPVLSSSDLVTLGADVVMGEEEAAAAARIPRVRSDAQVVGDMSREIVRRIARRHRNEVQFCYQQGLNRQSDLEGTVAVRFELSSTGMVVRPELQDGSLDSEGVRRCILTATRRWRFPNPGPGVTRVTLTFDLDTVAGGRGSFGAPGPYQSFVLTRLHYRYEKDGLDEDLVFRAADPIVGGREMMGDGGELERGAQPAGANNFQGRYIIRHRWEGPIECDEPVRGVWGGPPEGIDRASDTLAATDTALVDSSSVQLASLVREDVPALGLVAGAAQPAAEEASGEEEEPEGEATPAPPAEESNGGCAGCTVAGRDGDGWLPTLLLAPVLLLRLGRRRRG